MSFSVIIQLAAIIGYGVVIIGGKQKRDKGWKVVSGLMIIAGIVQCAAMSIVVRRDLFPWPLTTLISSHNIRKPGIGLPIGCRWIRE